MRQLSRKAFLQAYALLHCIHPAKLSFVNLSEAEVDVVGTSTAYWAAILGAQCSSLLQRSLCAARVLTFHCAQGIGNQLIDPRICSASCIAIARFSCGRWENRDRLLVTPTDTLLLLRLEFAGVVHWQGLRHVRILIGICSGASGGRSASDLVRSPACARTPGSLSVTKIRSTGRPAGPSGPTGS